MRYNDKGEEIPDPTPVEVPVGIKRDPPLHELIKLYVRTEMSRQAAEEGNETFDEANDFGDEDDLDLPMTPYETRVLVDEDVVSHVERKRLDRRSKKDDNVPTVDKDRIKESDNVRQKGNGDSKGSAGDAPQADGASGGSASAGRGGESVSGGS